MKNEQKLTPVDEMELANLTELLSWDEEVFRKVRKLAHLPDGEKKKFVDNQKTRIEELLNNLGRRFNDIGEVFNVARETREKPIIDLLSCVEYLEVSRLLDMGEINRVLRGKEQEV